MKINQDDLTVSSDITNNVIHNKSKLNASFNSDFTVSDFYHISEIRQNEKINNTARWIIWAGFCMLIIGVLFVYFGKIDVAVIATVSGIFTEVVSGVVMTFLTKSNKSKLKYFEQLSFNEECDKYLKEIRLLKDENEKNLKLQNLIDNYCNRRK